MVDFVSDAIFQLVVLAKFYFLVLYVDVAAHIKTCLLCQVSGKPNQHVKPAPLQPIVAVDELFAHLIVDCVGPLPPSK